MKLKPETFRQLCDPFGLGLQMWTTDDVQQSGGGYVGFSFEPGSVGWAVASTAPIRSADPTAMIIPEMGMIIERVNLGAQGKARYEARTWYGMAAGSTTLGPQRKVLSLV